MAASSAQPSMHEGHHGEAHGTTGTLHTSQQPAAAAGEREHRHVVGRRHLLLRKENVISTPYDTLLRACVKRLGNEKDKMKFIDFARRVEDLYRCRIAARTRRLRRGFQLFMANSGPSTNAITLTKEEEQREESALLEQLHFALKGANYRLLSNNEYQDALSSEYTLNLDLEMRTELLDSSFIERFLLAHQADPEMKNAAEINRHVLVYHRGVGVDKVSGPFVLEKIDYIFSNIFSIAYKLLFLVLLLLRPWAWRSAAKKLPIRRKRVHRSSSVVLDEPDAPSQEMVLTRQSLKDTLDEAFFTNVLAWNELQEPTFNELVVIYRMMPDPTTKKIGQPTEISIKSFHGIPRADFEIVLPAQAPKTRAFGLFKLLLALGIGIASLSVNVTEFFDEQGSVLSSEPLLQKAYSVMPLLVAVVSYATRVLFQFQAQQSVYKSAMTRYLYDKAADSGDGVRTQLVDSTVSQEVKEAILAYFFLWQTDADVMPELDEEIEEFSRTLGDDIDFEVDDAVRKLLEDNIVSINSPTLTNQSKLTVLKIDKAIARVEELWRGHFVDKEQECPYCPYMENGHSVEA